MENQPKNAGDKWKVEKERVLPISTLCWPKIELSHFDNIQYSTVVRSSAATQPSGNNGTSTADLYEQLYSSFFMLDFRCESSRTIQL